MREREGSGSAGRQHFSVIFIFMLGSDDRQDQSAEDVTETVVLFLPTLFLSDSHKTLTSECVDQNDRG